VVGSATLGSEKNQVNCVSLADGSVLWTYTDTGKTAWEDPLACVDTVGKGVKTVFVWFHNNNVSVRDNNDRSSWGRLLALSGSNGSLLWSTSFPNPSGLIPTIRFADITGDGKLAVLLNVKNTIEAFDGTTGALLKTYTFSNTVTTFDAIGAAGKISQAGTPGAAAAGHRDSLSLAALSTTPAQNPAYTIEYNTKGD
jgi:outer membrane protein assembly factor BamB